MTGVSDLPAQPNCDTLCGYPNPSGKLHDGYHGDYGADGNGIFQFPRKFVCIDFFGTQSALLRQFLIGCLRLRLIHGADPQDSRQQAAQ